MTSSTASLIGLPRELRNNIYDYLTWTDDVSLSSGPRERPYYAANVKVTDLPIASVLSVNTQINAEYSETIRFRRPSGIFEVKIADSFATAPASITRSKELLKRVRHATVFVDNLLDGYNYKMWWEVTPIVTDIVNHMPQLDILRLAVHQRDANGSLVFSHAELLQASIMQQGNSATRLLPSPPQYVAGLTLA